MAYGSECLRDTSCQVIPFSRCLDGMCAIPCNKSEVRSFFGNTLKRSRTVLVEFVAISRITERYAEVQSKVWMTPSTCL